MSPASRIIDPGGSSQKDRPSDTEDERADGSPVTFPRDRVGGSAKVAGG
jgi:hypothetical protein